LVVGEGDTTTTTSRTGEDVSKGTEGPKEETEDLKGFPQRDKGRITWIKREKEVGYSIT
jgi:hypothetical protein